MLELAHEIRNHYRTGAAHGDFAPWHLLKDGSDSLLIVDTEFASQYQVLFYDVVHLYHRVYTATGRRDLARLYAAQFRGKLRRSQRPEFDHIFRSLLAFRTMACYVEFVVADLPKNQVDLYACLSRDIFAHDLY